MESSPAPSVRSSAAWAFPACLCRLESHFPPYTSVPTPLDSAVPEEPHTFCLWSPLKPAIPSKNTASFFPLEKLHLTFQCSVQGTLLFNRPLPRFPGKINHFPSSLFLLKSVSGEGLTFCMCLSPDGLKRERQAIKALEDRDKSSLYHYSLAQCQACSIHTSIRLHRRLSSSKA